MTPKAVLLCFALACTGGSKNHTSQAGSAPVKADERFVRGASVSPGDQLIAWLDKQVFDGKPRLLRVPVVLKQGATAFSTRGARIGGAADSATIFVDDSKLGIGLADRARTMCKDQATCAIWLEGYWRGQRDGDYTFEVIKVGDPIATIADASHVLVEGDSRN